MQCFASLDFLKSDYFYSWNACIFLSYQADTVGFIWKLLYTNLKELIGLKQKTWVEL